MPSMSNRDLRSLPRVSPPPYRNPTPARDDHGNDLPHRSMGEYGGLPQGPSLNRHGDNESADPFFEWNPGEFQRVYPKNKQNAAWYAQHRYGRLPGKDFDGWMRRVGPFPSEAGAAKAIAKRAKKGKK